MTTVAFIGLGIMGGPMAANLVKAGYEVVGYNRQPGADAAAGRRRWPTARQRRGGRRRAPTWSSRWFPTRPTSRPSPAARTGSSPTPKSGALYIDMSTIRPDVVGPRGRGRARRGLRVLDAPVSGGEAGAIEASLSIMVGGEAADFAAAGRCSTRSARRSCTSGPPARARPSRPRTSSSSPATSSCSPRRRLPRGVRRGHGGRAGGARRRPGRQHRADRKGAEHARPRVRPRLPARPAPQGPGDRHLGRPRGRRGHPARWRSSPSWSPPWWPRATAAWTTPACSSSSRAVRPRASEHNAKRGGL